MSNGKDNPEEKKSILGMIELSEKEYQLIRDYVYNKFGINLTEQKKSLIFGRLNSLLKKKGFTTFESYLEYVKNDTTGEAQSQLIDRISTNHTFFWRENDHFTIFKEAGIQRMLELPDVRADKNIRVWVAGSSSGEESYMLAMLLHEYFASKPGWKYSILATDIASSALQIAVKGQYSETAVEKMPSKYLKKYFKKIDDETYEVIDEIKKIVTYRRLNLMNATFPFKKKFHSVFCRNVMIYFDRPTRDKLIEKFALHMAEDTFLFIGHSETLDRSNTQFKYVKPALYLRG